MRNRSGWWIIVLIMIALDFYVFQVIKALASGATERTKLVIYAVYWTISVAAAGTMLLLPYLNYESWPKNARTYVFVTIIGLFFAKLIAALFFLLDDVRRFFIWLMAKV
ncbi:MAG TPA: metallophosphoesterase, partial [Segetibacter sp.]